MCSAAQIKTRKQHCFLDMKIQLKLSCSYITDTATGKTVRPHQCYIKPEVKEMPFFICISLKIK